MTKAEAKRNICKAVAYLIEPGHENEFLYRDQRGVEYSAADSMRLQDALEELTAELRRRGDIYGLRGDS